MPRSSSPRQGDPRYWRQWTVRGANLDQIISPQQRTHYLRFSLLPHKQGGKRLCTLQGSCDHKKSKREKETSTFSSRRKEQRNVTFFQRGLPAKYGGRQGKSFFPYTSHPYQNREGDFNQGRRFTISHRQGRPFTTSQSYHWTKIRNPSEEVLRLLNSLQKATWRA